MAGKARTPFALPEQRECACYCRYSTLGQKKTSIDRQDELTEEYRVAMVLPDAHLFSDEAQTGYNSDRSGFRALIKFCEEHHGTDLIVESLSRLVRDGLPYTEIVRLRRQTGLRVHSVLNGGLLDEYQEQILVAQASQEYRMAAYYMRAGWLQAAKAGKWVGKKPWGTFVNEDRQLQIDPEAKQIIIDVYEMRAAGVTVEEIIENLKSRAPIMKGSVGWTKSGVNSMLSRRTYTGHIKIRRKKFDWERSMYKSAEDATNPNYEEFETFMEQLAIIPLELWERVQHKPRQAPHRPFSKLFLAKLVKCHCCGVGMDGTWGEEKPIYLCTNPDCTGRDRFDAGELESVVFNAIASVLDSVKCNEAYATALNNELDAVDAETAKARRTLDRAVTTLENQYGKLRRSILLMDDDLKQDFQRDLKAVKAKLEDAKANRDALPSRPDLLIDGSQFPNLRDAIAEVSASLPLLRSDAPSAALHSFLRNKLVKGVTLKRNKDDSFSAKVDICVATGPTKSLMRSVKAAHGLLSRSKTHWDALAARREGRLKAGILTLPEEELALLEHVPGIGNLDSRTGRKALEAILSVCPGEEVSLSTLIKAAGLPKSVFEEANRLLAQCDLEEIEKRLSAHRGELVCIRRLPSGGDRSVAMRLADCRHPLLLVKLAYQGGNTAVMSDEQFAAIHPFLPGHHKIWRGRFDRLFRVLRNDLAWNGGLQFDQNTIRKFRKLHFGGRLREIVSALLRLEGWELPSDYAVPPLRTDAGTAVHDLNTVRRDIAQGLISVGGEYEDERALLSFVRFGPFSIDPVAGIAQGPKGETARFTPWARLAEMLNDPGEWIPWDDNPTFDRWKCTQFKTTLAKLGWKPGRTQLVTSKIHGSRMIFKPVDAEPESIPRAA